MTADDDSDAATHSDAEGTAHDPDAHVGGEADQRVTAPMQDYSTSQVGTGFVVLLVGLAVAYFLPSLV